MTRPLRTTVVILLTALSRLAGGQEATKSPEPHPEDWVSPDSLAAAVYSIVSGPASKERDWDRYRALFTSNATFTTFGETPEGLRIYTFGVEDYIRYYESSFEERGIYETEVWSRTDRYRHLAQRWGTCEYRWAAADGPPSGRCQVTTQFVHDGERWRIASMIWESESDDHPIAARYLPEDESKD